MPPSKVLVTFNCHCKYTKRWSLDMWIGWICPHWWICAFITAARWLSLGGLLVRTGKTRIISFLQAHALHLFPMLGVAPKLPLGALTPISCISQPPNPWVMLTPVHHKTHRLWDWVRGTEKGPRRGKYWICLNKVCLHPSSLEDSLLQETWARGCHYLNIDHLTDTLPCVHQYPLYL